MDMKSIGNSVQSARAGLPVPQLEADLVAICNGLSDTLQRINAISSAISRLGDRAYGEISNVESSATNVRPVRPGAIGSARDRLVDISDALDDLNKRISRIENIA